MNIIVHSSEETFRQGSLPQIDLMSIDVLQVTESHSTHEWAQHSQPRRSHGRPLDQTGG